MADPTYDSGALSAALNGGRRILLGDGTSVAIAGAIVLDLDGKGIDTLGRAKGGVRYDLDGDGLADRTSWIGPSDGILFLDRDGNGTVNNAAEFDFAAGGSGGGSALQGLRTYDSNNDGVFSALDSRFADFRVWQDRNGNGVAETGEVQTLGTAGVRSITLSATANTLTQNGDAVGIVATGSFTRTTGAIGAFADAVLTYSSSRNDGLPALDIATATFDRKSAKYRISARDGRVVVADRKGNAIVDARAGGLTGSVTMTFKHGTIGMLTAIVLDLDGNGVSTRSLKKSRGWFDMNGDGSPDRQGWAGTRDGFLVIDRNGDGVISGGSELSLLAEDSAAGGSLAALAKLDSNKDKLLDASDARFGELRVWIDGNGNGVTDQGELKTLADLKIKSISLDQRATSAKVKPGQNLTIATTTFTFENGIARTAGDVALAFRPSQPPAPTSSEAAGAAIELTGVAEIDRPVPAQDDFWPRLSTAPQMAAYDAPFAIGDTRAQDLLAQAATQLNLAGQGVLHIATDQGGSIAPAMLASGAASFHMG